MKTLDRVVGISTLVATSFVAGLVVSHQHAETRLSQKIGEVSQQIQRMFDAKIEEKTHELELQERRKSILEFYGERMAETFCLAANIYHEARGESERGQRGVARVTLNRVKHKNYPDTVCDVVFQPYQFSWTLDEPTINDKKSWKIAWSIAEEFMAGFDEYKPSKSTHYVHNSLVGKKWTTSMTMVATIGNHTFYK